ncbi:MAG: patatin-like phospholipase family protein [Candidatus Omnitrophica bacterium]|nr:patatin-like phospholipase family protein [Candidatus Omnitrophota bacterium]
MRKEKTKSLDKFFLVSSQPLFEGLSDKEKTFIANRSQLAEYNKNDVIYREGQRKDFLYIIISGRISLFHPESTDPSKEKLTVEILRKGDYCGIISLFSARPHSVSAKVLNDARILKIDQRSFKEILSEIPRLAVHFSRTLSRRLKTRHRGVKKIFQSMILAVHYGRDDGFSSFYAMCLASSIKKESGKLTTLLCVNKDLPKNIPVGIKAKKISVTNPKKIASILDNYTGMYHFIIVDLPAKLDEVTEKFMKQADLCHLICDNSPSAIRRAKSVMTKADAPYKRPKDDFIKVILREVISDPLFKSSYKVKMILSSKVYATLPPDIKEFHRAVRRISRETSGTLVGLALGSGGALGLAEIGVLEVLEKEKIPIDTLAGTSIGALIGALWASGYCAKEIKDICTKLNTKLKMISLIDITFPKRGLFAGRKVHRFLEKYLGDKTFYDIKLPFKVVACDIKRRAEVVISSGRLVDAVMASIAIPGVFNPHIIGKNRLLVDGGIVNPLPISVLTRSGIKRIIAVNSIPSPEDGVNVAKSYNIIDIMVNSLYSMEYKLAKYASREADVYIHPILKDASWYEFYKADEFIKLGKKKTREALPEIKSVIGRR